MSVVVVGCGSATENSSADTAPADSAPADNPTAAPASADTTAAESAGVLDIQAATSDGGTIDLADYAGQDLMLWFWAPW